MELNELIGLSIVCGTMCGLLLTLLFAILITRNDR